MRFPLQEFLIPPSAEGSRINTAPITTLKGFLSASRHNALTEKIITSKRIEIRNERALDAKISPNSICAVKSSPLHHLTIKVTSGSSLKREILKKNLQTVQLK
jgi:hypothetical protein